MQNLENLKSFLTALGFTSEESVFFRLITPKDFSASNPAHNKLLSEATYKDKNGKLQNRKTLLSWNQANGDVTVMYGSKAVVKSTDIVSYLNEQSVLGMAVYIVVNPGGQAKSDITNSRVIYYESDTNTIEEQVKKFQELNNRWGGGFALKTAKSVHAYFRLSSSITPQQFTENQKRLIEYLPGADECIHDPSRVMRVPGFDHLKMVDNELIRTPIEMIHEWDGTFTNWELINSELPTINKAETNITKLNLDETLTDMTNNPYLPSLTTFLAIEHRDAIKNGVEIGNRNNMAYRLAKDLIGTARTLASKGINYCDTPELLYEEYGTHCDTAASGELEDIWDRAVESNPNPCLDLEKMATNNKAYYTREMSGRGFSIAHTDPQESIKVALANNYPQSILAQELEYIDNTEIKIPTYKDEATKLWANIRDRYPIDVVKSIEANHRKLGIQCYVYAGAYDCVVSGMLNGKYLVRNDSVWTEPLNIFMSIVGIQGVNKSHIISWLTGFLSDKNSEYRAEFKAAKRQYTKDLAAYSTQCKQDPNGDYEEPIAPELRYASHGKTTTPKLIQALDSQKNQFNCAPNLLTEDEMTSLFSFNEKNGVNLADVSFFLSAFSGKDATSNTKGDGLQGVSKVSLSVITTTQPKTLTSLAKSLSDGNGFIQRWLTPIVEENDCKKYNWLAAEEPTRPIGSHIEELYHKFDVLNPGIEITISKDGRQALSMVEDWVFEQKSLRAKPKSYILRIAGLYAVYDDYQNPVINSEHVCAAWEVMKVDELNKTKLGINKDLQNVAEEVLDKAIEILLSKGYLAAGKLGAQVYALRSVPLVERQMVIDKVAQIMGDKVRTETTTNGKSVLVLVSTELTHKDEPVYVPEIIPVVEVDKPSIDTVDCVSSPILATPTEDGNEVEEEIEFTYELSDDDIETIYISDSLIPIARKELIQPDGIYKINYKTPTSVFILMKDDSSVLIPISQIETQNATNSNSYTNDSEF